MIVLVSFSPDLIGIGDALNATRADVGTGIRESLGTRVKSLGSDRGSVQRSMRNSVCCSEALRAP